MKKFILFLVVIIFCLSCDKKEDKKEPIEISAVTENVTIYGISDGSITLTVTGGLEPYTYLWSNGATSKDITNIPAGSYTVTVSDAASDTASHTEVITQPGQPAELKLAYTNEDVSKVGEADGSITLNITGGTKPYSISWSNGATDSVLTELSAGTYSVTVSDAGIQEATEEIEILAPLAIALEATNVSSYNGTDGAIDLTISGGKAIVHHSFSSVTHPAHSHTNTHLFLFIVTVIHSTKRTGTPKTRKGRVCLFISLGS
jgi:hypothetical protein